jgi:hypothetical protein
MIALVEHGCRMEIVKITGELGRKCRECPLHGSVFLCDVGSNKKNRGKEEGEKGGQSGEMTQTMYAHVNK